MDGPPGAGRRGARRRSGAGVGVEDGRRTVLVTGGTGAFGAGVVQAMLEARYRVVATWIVDAEREAAEARFRGAVDLRRVDVGDPEQVDALAADLAGGDEPWAVAHLVG